MREQGKSPARGGPGGSPDDRRSSSGIGVSAVAVVVDRGVVRVIGPDAASYLQGQISQDIDQLEAGSSAWSLVLQPTGKLTAWFRIHRMGDDEFLLDVDPLALEAMIARLERFKLRTAVDFVVEPGWRMLSSRGGDAPPADGLSAPFEWMGFSGTDVLAVGIQAPAGLEPDEEAFEVARIRATVPRMGIDLDNDTIPAEGGAPLIEMSVSFTKGCFTGQELVARINSRGGNVPHPLRTLVADEPVPVGATVRFEGAEVGVVTSAAGSVALGRILRKAEPGAAVDIDGAAATVRSPPT
jgi:tRNA-modifying protein YgfZ